MGLLVPYKFLKMVSSFFKVSSFVVGRDNRMCVISEINRLLVIAIFPRGVMFLPFHTVVSLSISFILHSIFWSVILFIFCTSYVIPREVNCCVQISFKS